VNGYDFERWKRRYLRYEKIELGEEALNVYALCQSALFGYSDPDKISVQPTVCRTCGCNHERLCRGPNSRYWVHPKRLAQEPTTLKVVNGGKSH